MSTMDMFAGIAPVSGKQVITKDYRKVGKRNLSIRTMGSMQPMPSMIMQSSFSNKLRKKETPSFFISLIPHPIFLWRHQLRRGTPT